MLQKGVMCSMRNHPLKNFGPFLKLAKQLQHPYLRIWYGTILSLICCPKLLACKGVVYGSEGFINILNLQILHTILGDIHVCLYPEECPRTLENFTTHYHNGYYDDLIFHIVIKGFMVQIGNLLSDGTWRAICLGW